MNDTPSRGRRPTEHPSMRRSLRPLGMPWLGRFRWGHCHSQALERLRNKLRLWHRSMRSTPLSSQPFRTAYQRATELPSDKPPPLPFWRSEASIMPPTLWFTHLVHGLATGSRLQIRFPPIHRLPPITCRLCFRVGDTSSLSSCVAATNLSRADRHGYRGKNTQGTT